MKAIIDSVSPTGVILRLKVDPVNDHAGKTGVHWGHMVTQQPLKAWILYFLIFGKSPHGRIVSIFMELSIPTDHASR